MVIKLYISGISGNKEVKKKQQRVQMILDSKQIDYEAIDITEPGKEKDKEFMQQNGKVRESLGKYPLPPQIFNDEDFCGDYEDFDLANEVDELEKFLHIETSAKDSENGSKQTEEGKNNDGFQKEVMIDLVYNPYEYHTIRVHYDIVNGLKEEIISNNDIAAENITTEEVSKTEVNGEGTVFKISADREAQNVESSAETAVAPEKEESSTQEEKANDDEGEIEKEDQKEDNQKQEVEGEGEAAEQGEEKEEVESPKEDKEIEEETSPPLEEKEADDDKEDKEEMESEKEDKESDNESPQSEKSEAD